MSDNSVLLIFSSISFKISFEINPFENIIREFFLSS
ncbi:hypothetical protein ECP03023084_5093, partial [Escherichia coli P0302308.4]